MSKERSVELSTLFPYTTLFRSRSLTVTLRAVPVPPLVTTMENPMVSPAETLGASAVLARSVAEARDFQSAGAVVYRPLLVLNEAVLATGESAGVAPVVGDEMGT